MQLFDEYFNVEKATTDKPYLKERKSYLYPVQMLGIQQKIKYRNYYILPLKSCHLELYTAREQWCYSFKQPINNNQYHIQVCYYHSDNTIIPLVHTVTVYFYNAVTSPIMGLIEDYLIMHHTWTITHLTFLANVSSSTNTKYDLLMSVCCLVYKVNIFKLCLQMSTLSSPDAKWSYSLTPLLTKHCVFIDWWAWACLLCVSVLLLVQLSLPHTHTACSLRGWQTPLFTAFCKEKID